MNRILYIIFLSCFTIFISAQDVVYDFPIKPGTKEWENLKTEKDRLESLQIPDEVLKNMSTDNLIRTCINYPAFGYFTAFNNTLEGINQTINNFNGLQELFRREDAPSKLLFFYTQMDSVTLDISDKQLNKEFWPIRRCFFEYLLACDYNLTKMNESSRLQLLIEARKKFNHKVDNKKEFSTFSFEPTLLIMAKVLDMANYEAFKNEKNKDKEIGRFLDTGVIRTPNTLSAIIDLSANFIKLKKH